MLADLPVGKVGKDAKTRLQEWLQARQFARPDYDLLDTSGDHARSFLVRCRIESPPLSAESAAGSLRAAEQAAAALVLAQLEATR